MKTLKSKFRWLVKPLQDRKRCKVLFFSLCQLPEHLLSSNGEGPVYVKLEVHCCMLLKERRPVISRVLNPHTTTSKPEKVDRNEPYAKHIKHWMTQIRVINLYCHVSPKGKIPSGGKTEDLQQNNEDISC